MYGVGRAALPEERGAVLDARLRGHDGSCHPREGGGPCSAWGAQGCWLSAALSWMPACAGMTGRVTPAQAGGYVRRGAAGALVERGGGVDARLRGHDGSCHPREGGGPCSAWGATLCLKSAAASWMPACAGMTARVTPAKAGVHVRRRARRGVG